MSKDTDVIKFMTNTGERKREILKVALAIHFFNAAILDCTVGLVV